MGYNPRPMNQTDLDSTQPNRAPESLGRYQPIRLGGRGVPIRRKPFRPAWWVFLLVGLLAGYFFAPGRSNILVLGADSSAERGALGRTDTIILASVDPWAGRVGMLSIPRDLWVTVPGVGAQRINTAYFFAEANDPGSGPGAAMQTVRQNFGVSVHHSLVLEMDGLVELVDALGGVEITLEQPMGGLPAGRHTLDGAGALAFARERYSADDFSRIRQTQLLMQAAFSKLLHPLSWPRLPLVLAAAQQSVDSNIPLFLYPRLGLALLRAAPGGVDTRSITREMVTPFQTEGGAQVLAPNWERINPLLFELFGE